MGATKDALRIIAAVAVATKVSYVSSRAEKVEIGERKLRVTLKSG